MHRVEAGSPALRFNDREIELAHQLAALGIEREIRPGMVVYSHDVAPDTPSPFQPHILLLDGSSQSPDRHATDWTWLPSWSEGRRWLRARGLGDAEVLDRVRERVVEFGCSDLEALYELMLAVLRREKGLTQGK